MREFTGPRPGFPVYRTATSYSRPFAIALVVALNSGSLEATSRIFSVPPRDWLRAFLIGGGARGCQFDRLLLAVPLERPIGRRAGVGLRPGGLARRRRGNTSTWCMSNAAMPASTIAFTRPTSTA